MRLLLGLVLASTGLFGQSVVLPQFRNLATTDDGSRLYFSSPLPLTGASDAHRSRIFVFDRQGLHLFADQSAAPLGWPSASGDGSTVAFSGILTGKFQANFAQADGSVVWTSAGQAGLSRNGRFALAVVNDPSGAIATVADLASGATSSTSVDAGGSFFPVAGTGRTIASDGTAVLRGTNVIYILQAGTVQSFPIDQSADAAVIDDNAATVAYQSSGRIMLLDLATDAETTVAAGSQPCLTNDGQTLLYLAPDAWGTAQAWIGQSQLTTEGAGIAEAVISGDGSTVYALTGAMHLLRFDAASGSRTDLTAAILATATPEAPQVVSFTVAPSAIAPGATAQLCYNVQNAATVSIQPAFGEVPSTSACLTASPSSRTTYTLTATNDAGSITASTTLDVAVTRILTFTNDPAYSPVSGSAVTLSWTTENASMVRITGLGAPATPLPAAGSLVVNPVTNTTYTLNAYGANGQAVNAVLYIFVR
jgi:hypothetical protein